MSPPPDPLSQFVALSASLTGFDGATLHGTGLVQTYYETLVAIVGESIVGRLLGAWSRIAAEAMSHPGAAEQLVVSKLLSDPVLGPVAKNLTTLWYLGQWVQLPTAWRNQHGASALDLTRVISSEAWVQGLVWDAIHSHPPGAKQPGYGSWALPPANGATRD